MSGITSASVIVRSRRSALAPPCGTYPRSSIASSTRWRVASGSETWLPFRTYETSAWDTPARRATSACVGRRRPDPRGVLTTPSVSGGRSQIGGSDEHLLRLDPALLADERDRTALRGEPWVGDVEHDAAVHQCPDPFAGRIEERDAAWSHRCRDRPPRSPRARTANGRGSRAR